MIFNQDNILIKIINWVRFDPRLGEIIVHYLIKNWKTLNPILLNEKLSTSIWPQTFGVICDHVQLFIQKSDKKLFKNWYKCIFGNIKIKKDYSTFYIGIYSFGSVLQMNEVEKSLEPYSRWGYYSSSPIVEIKNSQKSTLLNSSLRLSNLKKLSLQYKIFRVLDYIKICDFQISKRIAELDLKKWAIKRGNTKGAYYVLKSKYKKK